MIIKMTSIHPPPYDDDLDDFTDARSYLSTETETDCDCFEDYTCEFHCDNSRYDRLFSEAFHTYQRRCKENSPNPSHVYNKLNKLTKPVIKQYADNIDNSQSQEERMIHMINLARFIMSEPGINHTKYQEIIIYICDNLYNYRQAKPRDLDVQRAYRDWARYLLDVR
jgi:hypothetical protein